MPREEQPALVRRIGGWLKPGGHEVATWSVRAWEGSEPDRMGWDVTLSGSAGGGSRSHTVARAILSAAQVAFLSVRRPPRSLPKPRPPEERPSKLVAATLPIDGRARRLMALVVMGACVAASPPAAAPAREQVDEVSQSVSKHWRRRIALSRDARRPLRTSPRTTIGVGASCCRRYVYRSLQLLYSQ